MDRRQTRRMIHFEASIISVFGSLLGVVAGIFFGWAILRALESRGFTTFVVPVGSLIGWVIATGVPGIVFAFLPAWRASKLNVLEAIAYGDEGAPIRR
jgi:putative ABC transport system permease protein